MSVSDRQAYHKIITDSYDERSKTYNDSYRHRKHAEQLVDYGPPEENDVVLDIGTGTGAAAFRCAEYTGPGGRISGVDISHGMLNKARELLKANPHGNIDFTYGDGEHLDFAHNSFDRIYCSNAFFWIADKARTLKHWFRLLKPGGVVGFHAWPEDSYVFGYVSRQVLLKYGINYLAHSTTGNQDKCLALLEQAGYSQPKLIVDAQGSYLSLQEAKEAWIDEDHYPIGQYPHPVTGVPEDILNRARADYEAEMERRNTDKGVWNDTTMYYVYGQKPAA